jgi:hypothetical protein
MVQKFSGIVKRQMDYWRYQVAHYGPDHPQYRPAKISKYEYLIQEFGELLRFLERLEQAEPVDNPVPAISARVPAATVMFPPPAPSEPQDEEEEEDEEEEDEEEDEDDDEAGDPTDDDLSDLPPELLKELSESFRGETDPLIKIIQGRGGTATLDEILIDLYRKYKDIGKRPIISNKLYRLSRRGLCWSVPGKKGTYTTTKPTDAANAGGEDSSSGNDEGPAAATAGPSIESGVARLPEGPSKPSPVGSTPTTSTLMRRRLLSETSAPHLWTPKEARR